MVQFSWWKLSCCIIKTKQNTKLDKENLLWLFIHARGLVNMSVPAAHFKNQPLGLWEGAVHYASNDSPPSGEMEMKRKHLEQLQ